MKKAKKDRYSNQTCQREYWLEMYNKENQKHEKRFIQREIKKYDESDLSNEAYLYRATLKYYSRAAIRKVEEQLF